MFYNNVRSLPESARIELVIPALFGNKLLVVAALYDTALFENHDNIGVLYRRKTVSDDEYRSALHEIIHALLDDGLSAGID